MELLPAIDLRHGQVVRLTKGDDARRTVYDDDPARVLDRYREAGIRRAHVVDLDAALGEEPQLDLIRRLLKHTAETGGPKIQLGGGLRDRASVERALALGCDRVILGSLVTRDFDHFAELAREHPGRLVPALDVKDGKVRIAGWTEDADDPLEELCHRLATLPCPAVLVTDIDRDGTLEGPNLGLARNVGRWSGLPALLSGGVHDLDDLRAARRFSEIGGAVVGKALYEGAFSLREAVEICGASGREPSPLNPLSQGERGLPDSPPRPLGEGGQGSEGSELPPSPSGRGGTEGGEGSGSTPKTHLAPRIIPCLDVQAGRVVKGVKFRNLVDQGDPAESALRYAEQGADEIVFLDITAAPERRGTDLEWVRHTAEQVFVPLTVGGGVRSVEDARELLLAGADKVGINSAAVADPDLLSALARRFGSQCVVLSVDALAREDGTGWEVVTQGGRHRTGLDVLEWIDRAVELGAGEILLTSIDADGTKDGYDLELLRTVCSRVDVPVIASGGVGSPEHLAAGLEAGAAAVLAASIFHEGTHTVGEVKDFLSRKGFPMRLEKGRLL